jgi:pimeloyl-ACP methyl ester carboxylesterase
LHDLHLTPLKWETDMIEHGSITLSGFQFTLLSAGPKDGEPVILLHGFPQFADVWTQLLATLGGSVSEQ